MKLTPRPYQAEAIAALWDAIRQGFKAPLLIEPTGSGKAFLIAMICQIIIEASPKDRILNTIHTKELVGQNFMELIGLWADAPSGIYSAGLKRRDMNAQILFAGIQSIYAKAFEVQQCDWLIIDECHLIPDNGDTMYRKFIRDLLTINPDMIIIGLTATGYRLRSGHLVGGEGSLFDTLAHETSVKELIAEGYLCPLVVPSDIASRQQVNAAKIDTSNVGTRMGEFIQGQLQAAATDEQCVDAICDQIVANGQDRRGWLIFGSGVDHCEMIVANLRARGFEGCGVYGDGAGKTASQGVGRDTAIAMMKRREYRFLVSFGVLTTGVNIPHIDLIADAGPTKSTSRYIQKYGRGTRTDYDKSIRPETTQERLAAIAGSTKQNCLILDFAGNIARHGPFDDPVVPEVYESSGEGETPFKECPNCFITTATATRICKDCGHEFPEPETQIFTSAASAAVMSVAPEWLEVSNVMYSKHEKAGKTPTLKVRYKTGLVWHSEWVCPEHSGFVRQKFQQWWSRRTVLDLPNTIEECLEAQTELKCPSHIMVERDGKYDRITGYRFDIDVPDALVDPPPTSFEFNQPASEAGSNDWAAALDDDVPF